MPRETPAQRIARIEDENARLRDELAAHEPRSRESRARGIGRATASVVLIVIAALLAPVALVANTTQRLLTDTDYFVATLQPIVDDEAVQQLVIDRTTDAIRTQAGLDALVADLFAGLDELGLPPRAAAALRLLQGPASEGLGALVERVVTRVVTSDAFRGVIAESLRISHTQLTAVLSGRSDVVSVSSAGEVGIALDPILDRVRSALTDAGLPLTSLVPSTGKVIVVATSAQLGRLVWLYQLAVAVGLWLQWVVIALLVGGVLVARRWAVAILGAGLALALAAAALAATLAAARVATVAATAGTLPSEAIGAIYDTAVASVAGSALAALVVGLGVALVAWLAGPFRASRALRGLAGAAADSLRTAAEHHGVTTGRFGELLRRARLGIRVAVGIVAAAIVLFVRPLTPAAIVWTLALALLVVVVARLLERPTAREAGADAEGTAPA